MQRCPPRSSPLGRNDHDEYDFEDAGAPEGGCVDTGTPQGIMILQIKLNIILRIILHIILYIVWLIW